MGELRSCGIPCTVILDSAVGYVMGEVHCVMLGAEGVAESGGIINKVGIFYYLKYSNGNKHDSPKCSRAFISIFLLLLQIGTYTIALCAKMLNKPVYVMCESFKFVRLYPLNQQDLPDEFKVRILGMISVYPPSLNFTTKVFKCNLS